MITISAEDKGKRWNTNPLDRSWLIVKSWSRPTSVARFTRNWWKCSTFFEVALPISCATWNKSTFPAPFLEGNFILKLTLISIQSANIFHSCRWRVHGVYPDGRLVRSVVSDRLGIQSVRCGIFRQGDNVKSFRSRASQAKRNQRWRFIDDSRRQDAHFHFLFHG